MRFEIVLLAALVIGSGEVQASHESQDTNRLGTGKAVSYDQSAQSLKKAFSGLALLESGDAFVAYDDRTSLVINKKRSELDSTHPLLVKEGVEADDILLLQISLSGTDSQTFFVLFSEGASADPSFFFIKTSVPDKVWAELPGTALAVPGNGSIYAANRFNNTFTRRTKHLYTPTGLTEVSQPYFYVGLKTHTLTPLTIYTEPHEQNVVARLPKGSEIEVLLTDDKRDQRRGTCFLMRTPFGLLGWAWIPDSQYFSYTIEGLSFWGD
jgi:hypothetical protein